MKKAMTVCRTVYLQWLCSTKMLTLLLAGVFIYIYCIEPMQFYAAAMQTPLNMIEPFVSITNALYAAPLFPLLFLFLISSFPRLDQSSGFMLFRIGRRGWFFGQILFLALAAFTFLAIFFVFSVLAVCRDAFAANGWSLAVRKIYEPANLSLFQQSGLAQIDLSVLNQFRPREAVLLSFLLMWGYMIVTGTVLLLFALRGKKVLGFFLNIAANTVGTVLVVFRARVMWLFPSAHISLANHYDATRNITYLDIRYSLLYNAALLGIVMYFAYRTAQTCSFHTIDATED